MPISPSHEGALTTYVAYGHAVASDLPLPELEASTLAPTIVIRTASEPLVAGSNGRRPLLTAGGGVWLLVGEAPGGALLSFPGVVDCVVDLEARTITYETAPSADPGAVRHALLDHVLPRLLVALGGTVLHASGVVLDGSAVLFGGSSGAGKSTLAARCVARGHQLLGDDAMLVDAADGAWRATPSYPGLRLWQDSVDLLGTPVEARPLAADTAKLRVQLPQEPGRTSRHDVAAVVLIERRPGPTEGRRLSGTEAFSRVWAITLGWPGTPVDPALLDRVATLAAEIPVLALGFDDRATADEVVAIVGGLAMVR